jgi:hypothetical protein
VRRLLAGLVVLALGATAARAQDSAVAGSGFRLPVRMSGEVVLASDLYGAAGIAARRPGASWRASLTPQITFLGEFSVGMDILLSSEGNQFRQSMSQFGLNPRYKWATLHIGDFSRGYSAYSVQGTRVRGGGLDLRPGIFRFSVQGGQLQRAVAAGAGGMAYQRNLYAASVGVGREQSSFLDLIVVKAKDDPASLTAALEDTTLLDTIPVALRPRYDTRPQENLVLATQGQLLLFGRRLSLKGEAASAVITRDVQSPAANGDSIPGGGVLGGLVPLTLSTSADYAWKLDGSLALGAAALRAGYEYVGPGFTSLGLAYVINDRRAYTVGGNVRLLGGRLSLQGQVQSQSDNLLGQKAATTGRGSLMGSAALLFSRNVTATLTAMSSAISNDAAVDTFVVDNRSLALTANTAVQHRLFGRQASLSLAYALQHTADGNVVTRIPGVTVHNASTSLQVNVAPGFSVAPSLSLALTRSAAAPTQRNVYAGVRANGRFGQVRTSFSASQNYSSARGVFAVSGQLSYTLPGDSRLVVQLRHNRYAAIGAHPAFRESFATMTVSRSF